MHHRHAGLSAVLLMAITGLAAASGADDPPRSGEAVYKAACANCHSGGFGGFFTGAPKVGKAADWQALAPKGLDALTATTLAGVGKMTPRGGCTDCSDAEIRAAVAYMLEKSQ